MASSSPRISIVLAVAGEREYLGEALGSLVEQDYPSLEVVIQHGRSSDRLADVAGDMARRYPEVFRLFVEQDRGFGDALERGFSRAGGEILSYMGADDLLLPRALHRVASEVSPEAGRHAVMGGAVHVVDGMDIAVPHPAEYLGHFEHLAIWKRAFDTVARSSVFWHRSVRDRIGAFADGAPFEVDYDFVCRLGARYRIHKVDEAWSACRMRESPPVRTEAEMLEALERISRRHWGPALSPLWWRCAASHWLHGRQPHEHARHHARRAEEAIARGRGLEARIEYAKAWLYSPAMARERLGGRRRRPAC